MLPHVINSEGESGSSSEDDTESVVPEPSASVYEVFELELQSSVYDEAFLCPLVAWHFDQEAQADGQRRYFRRSAIRAWAHLLLNYLLQGFVVGIMVSKTCQDNTDNISDVFGDPEGAMAGNNMCWIIDDATREFLHYHHVRDNFQQGNLTYYTCMPDEVLLASRFRQLDLNRDGKWTYREAQNLSRKYQHRVGRWVDLAKLYCRQVVAIWDALQSGKRLTQRYSVKALLGPAFAKVARASGSQFLDCSSPAMQLAQIPLWYYLEAIEPFMGICGLLDESLCNNLVLRGSWARDVGMEPSANATSLTCALHRAMGFGSEVEPIFNVTNEILRARNPCGSALTDLCPLILTHQSALWRTRKAELCGAGSTEAMEVNGLWGNVAEYETSDLYWGSWGTVTIGYEMFMGLVLFLWGLAMVSELQTVFRWMSVLVYMPSCGRPASSSKAIQVRRHELRVCAIPQWCRWAGLLSNVLPRLALYILTSLCGIRFLLSVGQLEDLILNCLALMFVITIDDMIYMAFADHMHKTWINQCGFIKVKCQDPQSGYAWWAAWAHIPGFLTVIPVVAMTLYFLIADYFGTHGKYALARAYSCLCEASGEECSLALVLGGSTSLPRF
mmetsp:Transcript_80271/g.236079  ORF Transcript_80271/g.236079 Transcript_80271/m.236079 type:complete len:614 (+) Transcript_80271:153-1994(+)